MPLIPDDFYPFQVLHKIGNNEIHIYGSRRKVGSTVAGSTKEVVKQVSDLTPQRRQRLAAIRNKLLAQVAEDGYVVRQLVLNIDDRSYRGTGLVVECLY